MAIEFRIGPLPGAEEESRRQLAAVAQQVGEQFRAAFEQLRQAQDKRDDTLVGHLENSVLPALWNRARAVGADQPDGMKWMLKVGKVRWAGEPAMRHLEALGFKQPTSRRQIQKRVDEFVRNLIRDGKGDSLPDDLFSLSLSLVISTRGR